MKKHIFKVLLLMLFVTATVPLQKTFATNDVDVVEGRIKNLYDPIDPGDAATKQYVDNQIEGIPEAPVVLQTEGQSETAVMSQKAVTQLVGEQCEILQSQLDETVNKKLIMTEEDAPDPNDITLKSGQYIPKNIHLPVDGGYGILENKVLYNEDGSLYCIIQHWYRYKYNETWKRAYHTMLNNQMVNEWTEWENTSVDAILDRVYPVGSIYMSVNSTNPSNYFGGTWSKWGTGRVPVCVDTSNTNFDSVEKTGGSSTHRHSWRLGIHWYYAEACGETETAGTGAYKYSSSSYDGWQRDLTSRKVNVNNSTTASAKEVTAVGKYSIGDTANTSTLQPYITCYMWKRTA